MLHRVASQKFINVSEMLTASIARAMSHPERLYGATYQKTTVFMLAAVRT
jgi:hypothetical protein